MTYRIDTKTNQNTTALLVIGGLCLLQLLLAALVTWSPIVQSLDSRISTAFALAENTPARTVASWVTALGSGPIVLPALLVISIVKLWQGGRLSGAAPWIGFLAARLVTDGLKHVIGRPRPALEELGYVPVGWDTLSFPSGHTTSAVFLYGFLALLCMDSSLSLPIKRLVISILAFIALAVGISRILLGEHFPSDVMGGVVSGCTGLGIIRGIEDVLIKREQVTPLH